VTRRYIRHKECPFALTAEKINEIRILISQGMTLTEVGKRTGRSRQAVTQISQRYGIPLPERVDWSRVNLSQDYHDIAKELRVTESTVTEHQRKALGHTVPWRKRLLEDVPDAILVTPEAYNILRELGGKDTTKVYLERKRRGLSRPKEQRNWQEAAHLFGHVSDREVGAQMGVSDRAASIQRRRRGIHACNPACSRPTSRGASIISDTELATETATALSVRYGLPKGRIHYERYLRNVKFSKVSK